jgi:preprotein translocase subunit SecA
VHSFKSFLSGGDKPARTIEKINETRASLRRLSDADLRKAYETADDLEHVIAIGAVAAARVLKLEMFDVQLRGALALAHGKIAEMQTGEGKTMAAVPAILWYARGRKGVHVMTANDYLARRDAKWMGGIYQLLGLSVAAIQQGMSTEDRRAAYRSDITYATGTELGFDYLRDQMAFYPEHQVHRPFETTVIDEADSILIDEARIPLVIAGGSEDEGFYATIADSAARRLYLGRDFYISDSGRNITLTDGGIRRAEEILRCGNLYATSNLPMLAALQNALHAHTLLRRDVDYIVKNGAVESVDEWKGRVVENRRWPEGLHTALEVKERVATRREGKVLGSITLQNLVALYPRVCGMTGTAASQAQEFRKVYGLEVEVIPTNRPVIRVDYKDALCETKAEKHEMVIDEIRAAYAEGQPVLVGTGSVEESEQLSARLTDIPHRVLNARQDEEEAAIISRAGEPGAVTISTNMAGRGTDIKLGEGVAELGGLYVIGTTRHEARRIDHQLRGRAGRQGDPGETRFFVSREDDLVVKYGGASPDEMQRMAEGQNLEIRLFLEKYESAVEGQRMKLQALRQAILTGEKPCASELERLVSLRTIDDLWSRHLFEVAEFRSGVVFVSWGGRDPLHEFLVTVDQWFQELENSLEDEIARRVAEAETGGFNPTDRGAVWTYITHDQAYESFYARTAKGLIRKYKWAKKAADWYGKPWAK